MSFDQTETGERSDLQSLAGETKIEDGPSNTVPIGIACAVAGLAIGIVVGFVTSMALLGSDFADEFTASVGHYAEYFDVAVVDQEKRGRGVYIRFENTGTRPVDDMYFEIEERDEAGRLIAEYEVNYRILVQPGATEETILIPLDADYEAAELSGSVVAKYKYGWHTRE